MSTPEWSIFDRIDELESITLQLMEKADTAEPTLKGTSTVARDARMLAELAFILGFSAYIRYVSKPIELKDKLIGVFKKQGLSGEIFDSLEKFMTGICEDIERKLKWLAGSLRGAKPLSRNYPPLPLEGKGIKGMG